jgi:hypothetical protein
MSFVQMSPARQLRAMFPLTRSCTRPRTGDWSEFHVGDRVYDIADERHVGEIIAISNSAFATIVWDETGWKSVNALRDLRHEREDQR